ncbi:MAG: M2 family metallopeptidase [Bacteroidetes bacterium]|nr:M2 family metallopeptidase [Bacteroidota bacterium]
MKKKFYLGIVLTALLFSCANETEKAPDNEKVQSEAQAFLDNYTKEFQTLYANSSEAEWKSNTYIKEGDTLTAYETGVANEALAGFTGSELNINEAKKFLAQKEFLSTIQIKQFEGILYAAANNPAIVKDLVKERIKAETAQNDKMFGFTFHIDNKEVTPNDIDKIMGEETNVVKRQKAWEASKEVGKELKAGLNNLQQLRNKTVQALGYDDYFAYQVSEYGMTVDEMRKTTQQMIKDVWPLYRELHTYARYTLAKKYNVPIPEMLPAHWLPNKWGQDWSGLVNVEGIDLDGVIKEKGPEWIVKTGEEFYMSLGFNKLPQTFYEKSSLYPVLATDDFKKNTHASAWHMDLNNDVRSLMSIIPNTEWYETTLHELGHIYYYMTYTNKDVPPLLRAGANRGFHEAMGSLMGLAAMQKPFLQGLDLLGKDVKTDETQVLLKEALNYVVFLPFSAGVMTEFEHELYSNNLSPEQYNAKWWELSKQYQGIVPPTERGAEYCDAASKTHINNDAAQYYDYAISYVLLFQFHDHIAKQILKQNPHATNYYGSKETGEFLQSLMYSGSSKDWRALMKEKLGSEMSAKPMLEYFEPLMQYLKKENEGRVHTLPESL